MVVTPGEERTLAPSGVRAPQRPGRGRPSLPVLVALLSGVVSIVAALALPFAPVSQSEPEVSWPTDPAAPTSTMLMLSAYRPLRMDATFSCRLAAQATRPGSAVLATTRPDSPTAVDSGLLVTATDGVLTVSSGGVQVVREPIGAAPCVFRVAGEGDTLVVSRDGRDLGQGPMPEVDALVTTVAALPAATPDDLSVRLTVDDRFSTSPAPLKVALLVVLAISAVLAVGALAAADRRAGRERPDRPSASVRRVGRPLRLVVDAGVVVTLLAWLPLAPLTPDDGYYSAMAANVGFEGYVGNYYQIFNQGFTPFTWIYQALAWWQQLVGLSPVALRVPALVCGLATWACLRRLVLLRDLDATHPTAPRPRRDVLATAVVGVCFLAWWMPFDVGVRPEPVIALATAACLLCALLAARRRSLLLAGTAVGIASLGATTSPSGLVALAPLLACAPMLWRTIRREGDLLATLARLTCVVAPGALGAVAAFGDGSLRDFTRAQELLYAAQDFESWYTEYKRWASILSPDAVYAIRAAPLLTVLALAAVALWCVAGRTRGRPPDRPLTIVAVTVVLGIALLAPSPSKPWMHLGALAGVGAVLLAMVIVDGPRALRTVIEGRRLPRGPLVASVATVVLTLALAGHGINSWWLSAWSRELPHAGTPPQVWIFRFDQPVWWLIGVIAVALAVRLVASRPGSPWRPWRPHATVLALSSVVVVFLAANVVYMVGTFGLQAVRTADSWSIPGSNLTDPLARECSAGSRIDAADPAGTPLAADPRAPSPPPGTGFAPLGWPASAPPPVPALAPPAVTGWGSLVPDARDPGALPDAHTGELTTPWLTVPAVRPDQAVTSLVAGRTDDGSSLTVEYGRFSPAGVTVLGSRSLGQPTEAGGSDSSSSWRSVELAGRGSDPPTGAEVLRLVARDQRTDIGGWIAVTAPRLGGFVSVEQIVAGGAPTAVGWPIAMLFPCVRQPRVEQGIAEPPTWAVGASDDPLDLFLDGTWQTGRGGLFGHAGREANVTALTAGFRAYPDIRSVQVYRLEEPYPAAGYVLTPARRTVPGWPTG